MDAAIKHAKGNCINSAQQRAETSKVAKSASQLALLYWQMH